MTRKQAATRRTSIVGIVASKQFARGFNEARRGLPFDPGCDDWNYERGRLFAHIAPLDLPLWKGRELNLKAVKLAEAAFARKYLL